MDGKYCSYFRKVNYYETDRMGIVHHSNYIRYFEEARLDMFDKMGLNYADLEKQNLMIPVLSVDCKYKFPLKYGNEMEIRTTMVKYDGLKMEMAYEIIRDDGVLCTTGHSMHCILDNNMKPVRMKRDYPEIYNKLKDMVID